MPLFFGEFGAYSKADADSRILWTSFLAREAGQHSIAWAYWELGAGFRIYDRETNNWKKPLLSALMP